MAQLLAVVAYPFLDDSRVGSAALGVISMVAVGLALWVVRSTPALTVIAVVLGVPAVLMTVLEAVLPGEDWVTLTSALLHAPFYFYVSYSLIRYLFHDDRVTTDELYGIGAAFTVVAWGFAYVYLAVVILVPGSIGPLGDGTSRFFDLLFFSFTNLTSVGLSDILPTGDHARSMVILEQVAGVLYVAMVISRLVALTVRQRAAEPLATIAGASVWPLAPAPRVVPRSKQQQSVRRHHTKDRPSCAPPSLSRPSPCPRLPHRLWFRRQLRRGQLLLQGAEGRQGLLRQLQQRQPRRQQARRRLRPACTRWPTRRLTP